jgi:hypothetical protein
MNNAAASVAASTEVQQRSINRCVNRIPTTQQPQPLRQQNSNNAATPAAAPTEFQQRSNTSRCANRIPTTQQEYWV